MKTKVADVRILIDRLLNRSGETATRKGFQSITDHLDLEIGDRYIYDHLFIKIKKLQAGDVLNVRDAYADALARYLGFNTYRGFTESLDHKSNLQLDSCIGSYYSYIRMNAKATTILQSPVKISYASGKYIFEQKGPRNTFVGEINLRDGCLFVLLNSDQGKSFYHIYKIGKMTSPQVIQGIFSGVSSEFQPIGGRAVLVKQDKDFSRLQNAQLKSAHREMKNLFKFLKTFADNNLSINKASTFTLADLE